MAAEQAAVAEKDVILGLFGVAAGLAGLALVFLGLIVTALQSFEGSTPRAVLSPYRYAATTTAIAFIVGLACVVASAVWLFGVGQTQLLYLAAGWLFAAQILALLAATVWTVWRLVWRR